MKDSILNFHFPSERFSREQLEEILPNFKSVAIPKGTEFLQEGNLASHYWFVESGFARSYVVNEKGDDITTQFFTTGDIIIDWSSFFLRVPSLETIEALSDCDCHQLDFDTFQKLFHSIPAFREEGRSRFVRNYFEVKTKGISLITKSAKERYLHLLQDKPSLVQNVSLKQIATYLGVTDTSLSRIRKQIAKVE